MPFGWFFVIWFEAFLKEIKKVLALLPREFEDFFAKF